jgi:hypothetical protein
MQYKPDTKTVGELPKLKASNMLNANPEYQRGAIRTVAGYPIPLVSQHDLCKEVAGAKREDFAIIDGQQRIGVFNSSTRRMSLAHLRKVIL